MKKSETKQIRPLPSLFTFCMGLFSLISAALTITVAIIFMLLARIRPGAYNVAFGVGFIFLACLYFTNLFWALGRRRLKNVNFSNHHHSFPSLMRIGQLLLRIAFIPMVFFDAILLIAFAGTLITIVWEIVSPFFD